MGSPQANGKGGLEGSVVRGGSEVACIGGGGGGVIGRGGEKRMGVWLQGLMFRHCACEQEWIKDKCVSESESEHV